MELDGGAAGEAGGPYKREDLLSLFEVGKANGEAFGHAAEDGGVDVVRPVRSTED